jgi:hypothetical protein
MKMSHKNFYQVFIPLLYQGRVDCIRSSSMEALEWAKAMCQGAGANVALESDKDEDDKESRKVTFSIYSVSFLLFIDL